MRTRSILLCLVAIGLLFGLWRLLASESWSPPPVVGTAPAPPSVGRAGPGAPDAAGDLAAERTVVPPAPSAPGADADADLHGTVSGPGRRPIAGARVVAELSEIEEYPLLDLRLRAARRVVGETVTDAHGRYRLSLPAGRQHRVSARAEGLAASVQSGCRAGSRVDFQLDLPATLTGTVREAGRGAAVPGTRIAVTQPVAFGGSVRVGEATADAAGRFRIDGLPAGTCLVDVQPEVLAAPRAVEVVLPAGGALVRDIVLAPGITIRGRVLDRATRARIAGAEVGEGLIGRTVRTDGEGAFELPGFEPHDNVGLRVRAAGYADADVTLRGGGTTPADTRQQVEVLLDRGRLARGVVVDAAGAPLANVYVAAAAADHEGDGGWFRADWRSAETGRDGAFAIGDLRPDMSHSLMLVHPGFATAVRAFPEDEGSRATIDFGEVRLQPPASLRGELLDERGEPVVGHEVELHGHDALRWRGQAPPADGYHALDSYVATRRCRTDDRGCFHFVDLAAGDYVVRAQKFDSHDAVACSRTVGPAEQVRGVALRLVRGMAIEGSLFVQDGGTLPKCYCSIDPEDGQATNADVEVRADGTFRAGGLAPGAYAITVYPYPSAADRAAGRSFASRTHAHVAAGSAGLRLELPVLGLVRGVVLDAARAPVAAAAVGAVDGDEVLDSAGTDAAGAFQLTVPGGRSVRVLVCAPGPDLGAGAFDRRRAAAAADGVAGGPPIEVVLPRR